MFDLKSHLAQVCPMYILARGSKRPPLALQEPCIGTVTPVTTLPSVHHGLWSMGSRGCNRLQPPLLLLMSPMNYLHHLFSFMWMVPHFTASITGCQEVLYE